MVREEPEYLMLWLYNAEDGIYPLDVFTIVRYLETYQLRGWRVPGGEDQSRVRFKVRVADVAEGWDSPTDILCSTG